MFVILIQLWKHNALYSLSATSRVKNVVLFFLFIGYLFIIYKYCPITGCYVLRFFTAVPSIPVPLAWRMQHLSSPLDAAALQALNAAAPPGGELRLHRFHWENGTQSDSEDSLKQMGGIKSLRIKTDDCRLVQDVVEANKYRDPCIFLKWRQAAH